VTKEGKSISHSKSSAYSFISNPPKASKYLYFVQYLDKSTLDCEENSTITISLIRIKKSPF
jgi:hypothetical protein